MFIQYAHFLYSNFDEEMEVVLVGFADQEFETKEYILLQRSTESDDQDKALGLDKVHITINGEDCSDYCDIKEIILRSDSLEIILDDSTVKVLQIPNHIAIRFNVAVDQLQAIKNHLELMFRNEPETLKCIDM
ncbi:MULTISPECIES: Imm10 family immunity protein [Paenibacillus]|uniref:Imm10 family immunity protein n=1 Tax=Paenibacillus TaxID=44249 RepID=UPI0022B89673|nr:Imm10 family immunity protein [Paenibacillus caseinilyticus]MCZ8518493.1 Imm10 family immunity protein [Paenibacillus caseinilyticus]